MAGTAIEFDEIELSRYYSQGAKGGPEFLTSILGSPYGTQQRNITRYDGIHRFEIQFDGKRETVEFPVLLDFFMSGYGAGIGFRFFPFFDNSWKNEQIAVTQAATASYKLIRTYRRGTRSYIRRIVKPVAPIQVTINGTDAATFSPYSVDYTKGIIAFQTPASLPAGGVLRVTGEYCIPVAFDTDKVDISGFGGTFNLEGLRVVELLPAALGINDSDAATYTPDTFLPSTPTNVAAAPLASSPQTAINISWNASSALNGKTIVGYKVKVNGGLIPNVVGQTSVAVGSLAPNTDYTVSVASYDSNGVVSAFSANITVRTAASTATGNAAPTATNLSITGTKTVGQTLTGSNGYFDAEGDLQNVAGTIFKWFRADTSAGAGAVEIGETTKLYTLTGADVGKFHRFSVVVAAQTGTLTGVETFSAWTTAAVQKFTPAAPTNAITDDANNTADWTYTPGFVGITFYEYSTNGGTSYANTLTKPIGSITGAHAAGQVLVRVKGSDIEGRNPGLPLAFGAYTASGAADTTAPTVGVLSATAFSKSRIDLSWTAATDAVGVTGYRITWSLSSAFTSPTTITVGNVLAYTHSGLANETTYYYKLEAFDAAANYSAYSNTVSAKTLTATTASAPVKAFDIGRTAGGVINGVDQDPISATDTIFTNSGTVDLAGIASPMTEDVYRRERYGQQTFPVTGLGAGASYRVEISMMEAAYTDTGRTFSISINGTNPANMQNIDIFAATGATFKPLVREATVSANASGAINIVTTAGVRSPTVSAIRIYDANTTVPAAFAVSEPSPLPSGTAGTAYSRTIATTGGTLPHTATSFTGNLPAGITPSISAGAARISGTTSATGTFNFTLSITDSAGATATKAFVLIINAAADTTAPTVGAMNAPTGITKSKIDLSWAAATDLVGVTGYRLTRSLSNLFTTPTEITLGNVLTYSNQGLANDTIYYYKLQAFDAAGNYSTYSNTVSARTEAATTTLTNYALASNGGVATASRSYDAAQYPPSATNNGVRAYPNEAETWVALNVNAPFPPNVQAFLYITLSAARSVSKFGVATLKQDGFYTAEPVANETLCTGGIHLTGYTVQYKNSAGAWTDTTIAITGNNLAYRLAALATPITATEFRLAITGGADGHGRVIEFEVWGVPADATTPPNEPVSTVETRIVTAQNGKIIIKDNGKLITF